MFGWRKGVAAECCMPRLWGAVLRSVGVAAGDGGPKGVARWLLEVGERRSRWLKGQG